LIILYTGRRFLGHFQPQQGKPALWELDSDQLYDTARHGEDDARYLNVIYVMECHLFPNLVELVLA